MSRGLKGTKKRLNKSLSKPKPPNTKGLDKGEAPVTQGELKTFNRAMVSRFIAQYALEDWTKIREIYNDPKAPMIEKIVCAIIIASFRKADPQRLDFLLNRAIGKVKDEIDLNVKDKYATMTDEELMSARDKVAAKNLVTLRVMATAIEKQQGITPETPLPDEFKNEPEDVS